MMTEDGREDWEIKGKSGKEWDNDQPSDIPTFCLHKLPVRELQPATMKLVAGSDGGVPVTGWHSTQ